MSPLFKKTKRRHFVPVLACLLLAACSPTDSNKADAGKLDNWPQQTIQIACFSSAGGGTDTVNRLIARAMEPELGVKINVVNRTGARGGAALNFVWQKPRDGYNWGGFSESILPAPVMGIHDTTSKDWTYFMVAGAPGTLSVRPDAPWKNLEEMVAFARDNPNTVKVAASSTGGIWHTKMLALEKAAGCSFQYMPFQGSQKSQTAVLTGEVDAVIASISEQAELIRGEKLRPLAMLESEPFTLTEGTTIPSAAETYPSIQDIPINQWLGFALPANTPRIIVDRVTLAFQKAMKSEELSTFAEQRLLTLYGYSGQQANTLAQKGQEAWTWMLEDLGIAVRSPKDLGIPRP